MVAADPVGRNDARHPLAPPQDPESAAMYLILPILIIGTYALSYALELTVTDTLVLAASATSLTAFVLTRQIKHLGMFAATAVLGIAAFMSPLLQAALADRQLAEPLIPYLKQSLQILAQLAAVATTGFALFAVWNVAFEDQPPTGQRRSAHQPDGKPLFESTLRQHIGSNGVKVSLDLRKDANGYYRHPATRLA